MKASSFSPEISMKLAPGLFEKFSRAWSKPYFALGRRFGFYCIFKAIVLEYKKRAFYMKSRKYLFVELISDPEKLKSYL